MRRAVFFSILGAATAMFLIGGTYALATTSGFVLGSTTANVPDALTAVVAKNADGHGGLNGPMIRLTNTSNAPSATALALGVNPGRAPFTTNSATKVTNLNADKLDGIDSSSFVQGQGGNLLSKKVYLRAGTSAEILNSPVKPPFNMVYACPSDLITAGQATLFNRSTLDADLIVQSQSTSDAVHGAYGTSIAIRALNSGVSFSAGWQDGHVATVWVYVNQRYNEPDAATNGCYVNVMAMLK
jgi:hypothetical protein